MEEAATLLNVRSLFPVLVNFEDVSLIAYVDARNRAVYNSAGSRMVGSLEQQVLECLKVPTVQIPDVVQKTLEHQKNIDYSKGKTSYA
jgi:hypothetical protein